MSLARVFLWLAAAWFVAGAIAVAVVLAIGEGAVQ